MKKALPFIGVGFVVLSIVVAGLAFYRLRCQVTYSLDFGSVIDAIVLLLVGVLVEYVYSQQSSAKQADTELLLKLVDDSKKAFTVLTAEAENCESGKPLTKAQQTSLSLAEKELSNAIHSLEEGLGHCKISLDSVKFQALKEARRDLKDSLTDSPFPGPYDQASRIHIRNMIKKVRDELTRMAFAINHR